MILYQVDIKLYIKTFLKYIFKPIYRLDGVH